MDTSMTHLDAMILKGWRGNNRAGYRHGFGVTQKTRIAERCQYDQAKNMLILAGYNARQRTDLNVRLDAMGD